MIDSNPVLNEDPIILEQIDLTLFVAGSSGFGHYDLTKLEDWPRRISSNRETRSQH